MAKINTKQSARRTLAFKNLTELSAELDRIEAAHRAGTLRTTGNWSPGQILEHCSNLMRCAIDGFPGKGPPAILRWIVILLFKKKAVSGEPPPPGIQLGKSASFLLPTDDVPFDRGMSEIREQIARITRGDRFKHRSPVFGELTHEQWTMLQLGHCSLHLGFMELG